MPIAVRAEYFEALPLGTSLGLDIGALLPFGDRNEESSYSEALEVVENGEEFHQTNQIIHGFKIGSKGGCCNSVRIKGSSDAFERTDYCCQTILYESQLSPPCKWD